MSIAESSPQIVIKHLSKRFGNTIANDDINLSISPGIHAIVGENGAGKSTLMKILAGVYTPDKGEVHLSESRESKAKPVKTFTPKAAIQRGVGMVHQHFMLVDTLTVAENVVLGYEPKGVLFDRKGAEEAVAKLSDTYHLHISPEKRVEDLSVGEKQRVEILKVLYRGAKHFIFDEPTAVLSPPEVEGFFSILRSLENTALSMLLITHKLDEVMTISEQITVMRGGRVINSLRTKETTPKEIAKIMVGREVIFSKNTKAPPRKNEAKPVLTVKELSVQNSLGNLAVEKLSFHVNPGEILGIAGVEGNGQTELILSICGVLLSKEGEIFLRQTPLGPLSPKARIKAGLSHIPEDRHLRGLVLAMSVEENLILGEEEKFTNPFGVLSQEKIREHAKTRIEGFDIRPSDPVLLAQALSGGNQQKIVVARELSRPFSLLLASQPTRGVDVGAIEFIHQKLREAREQEKAVLLLSADLDEILALSDRILVLYRGKIAGESLSTDAKRETLGAWMAGVKS